MEIPEGLDAIEIVALWLQGLTAENLGCDWR